MRCGIVVFPGSNCDHDVYHVLEHLLGCETSFLWHNATELGDAELVVVPGGFSYGDYLRAGALAAHSPILGAVKAHAANLPVILMTGFGYDPHHSSIRASQEGLHALLFKPFKASQLLDSVARAFAREASSTPDGEG